MNINNYFEQIGTGSPIVFIHGSNASTSSWKKIIEQLAKSYHCISIKLPGHCGTPDPVDFDQPTIDTELNIVQSVVAQLTNEPIHLVGHSYGGVVALAQALKGNLNIGQMTLFAPVAVWVRGGGSDNEMSLAVANFLTRYRQDVNNEVPYACGQVIDFWAGIGAFESLPHFIKDGMAPLTNNIIRHWDVCTTWISRLHDLQQCMIPTRLVCGNQSNPGANAICEHLNELLPT
ncbi:MAG: alpha/beta fold hydrolase, partial [Psychrobium sp.]|nr:alpha/beta fold hydrolase [Psychrobium sp.]